jgi:hypothetical protein
MHNIARVSTVCAVLLGIVAVPSVWASWNADGVPLCAAADDQYGAEIVSDGAGGAIVLWRDLRGGGVWYGLYAQRVNALGIPQWTADGVAVTPTIGIIPDMQKYSIASDGAGGAIVAWSTFAGRLSTVDVNAQRLNASGTLQWTANGVALGTAAYNQHTPRATSDGAGGAIVVWVHEAGAGSRLIYAQRLNDSGAAQWAADGVRICASASLHKEPAVMSDGAGGAIVAWQSVGAPQTYDLYVQRVNASGTRQWTTSDVALCTAAGDQGYHAITSDGSGGAIVAWQDSRSGGTDIYARRVNASGAVLWTANGVSICTAAGYQYAPALASDGAGGAIVTWYDDRSGNYDIYAQRVNASGAVLWTANGVPICTAAGEQYNSKIISDGAGGAIVTWQDSRSGAFDIYTQRINASGTVLWPADGVPICTAAGHQYSPAITSDGASGALVAWEDRRSGTYDLYVQRVCEGVAPVATLLQSSSALCTGSGVDIAWTLSSMDEGAEFIIARSAGESRRFADIRSAAITRVELSFAYKDTDVEPGTTYRYRVDILTRSGRSNLFETGPVTTPGMSFALFQNEPNPFNPSTTIRYYLPEIASIRLEVYSASGTRIAVLADGIQQKGAHVVSWDGRDRNGAAVSSGVYFCSLRAGKGAISRKMVLIR